MYFCNNLKAIWAWSSCKQQSFPTRWPRQQYASITIRVVFKEKCDNLAVTVQSCLLGTRNCLRSRQFVCDNSDISSSWWIADTNDELWNQYIPGQTCGRLRDLEHQFWRDNWADSCWEFAVLSKQLQLNLCFSAHLKEQPTETEWKCSW